MLKSLWKFGAKVEELWISDLKYLITQHFQQMYFHIKDVMFFQQGKLNKNEHLKLIRGWCKPVRYIHSWGGCAIGSTRESDSRNASSTLVRSTGNTPHEFGNKR